MNNPLNEQIEPRSITELISLIAKDTENIYPGEVYEEEIQELETELGTSLPSSYVEFIKKFGGGNFKHFQIYSTITEDENFYDLMEQIFIHSHNIPLIKQGDLLPFGDDYEGNIYCFDLHHSRDGEYIIVRWDSDFKDDDEPLHIANTFAEFLEKTELTSWVQNVVRQFGPYPAYPQDF